MAELSWRFQEPALSLLHQLVLRLWGLNTSPATSVDLGASLVVKADASWPDSEV